MSKENHQEEEGLPQVDQALANDASIVKGHARVRRQPIAGSPIAFFMLCIFAVVVVYTFFTSRRHLEQDEGQQYLYNRDEIIAFNSRPVGPVVEVGPDGAKLFAQQCVACHQATGLGVPGMFPPLAGSEWVNSNDGNVPVRVLLAGLSGPVTVKGKSFNGAMPTFGAVWSDAEIAAVVTHIRTSWGNESSEVTAEQVAEIRAEIGTRGNWTEDEIKAFF